jgi:hypothetical protein
VLCGLISLTGMILWLAFKDVGYLVALVIFSDALASVPTYRKAIKCAGSESWVPYAGLTAGSGITLLTVHNWTVGSCAFAVYLVMLGLSLTLVVATGQLRSAGERGRPQLSVEVDLSEPAWPGRAARSRRSTKPIRGVAPHRQ